MHFRELRVQQTCSERRIAIGEGGHARASLRELHHKLLSALPQYETPKFPEPFDPADDRRKMISSKLSHPAREHRSAVWKENLRFTVSTGIQQNLPWRGMAGVVLECHVDFQIAEGNPCRLAAPSGLDYLTPERQQCADRSTGLGRGVGLQPGTELDRTNLDSEHG